MAYDEIYSLPRPCPLYSTAERRASADAEVANRQDAHTHRDQIQNTQTRCTHTHATQKTDSKAGSSNARVINQIRAVCLLYTNMQI